MAFLYPWGNTQQLNLDWILQKIKELEAGGGGADLDEVANALISATYTPGQAYDRSDIVYHVGKLYRANQAIPAPGEAWTPAHWDEILLGDTVSNLVQYVAALRNDQIVNNSNVSGAHTSDALDTLNTSIANLPFKDYFYLGIANTTTIPTGTDYNSLMTRGNYYCASAGDAATMINCPVTYAHKLIVCSNISATAPCQILITNYQTSPLIFIRIRASNTWSPWRSISPQRFTDNVAAGTATQVFSHPSITPDEIATLIYIDNPQNVGSNIVIETSAGAVSISGTFFGPVAITYDVQ